MAKKIISRPGLLGTIHSYEGFFDGTNHYDNRGHKIGHSYEGLLGTNHYDNKGHKIGESWPGFFGGTTTRLKDKK